MIHRLALLVTGASGMALPRHVLTAMARHREVGEVHLVVSKGAVQVLKYANSGDTVGSRDQVVGYLAAAITG